jgi:protoporphyrinogen IX oxidase
MDNYFEYFKVAHIVFLISWLAGMFYLPRLFVYHAEVKVGTEEDKRFQKMEKRLLRFMAPSMVLTIVFGLMLAKIYGFACLGGWFHIKMFLVLCLAAVHGYFAKCRKDFARGENKRSSKFYRLINEIPAVIMVAAVYLVILKPFDD